MIGGRRGGRLVKGVDKLEVDEERWREATERAAAIRPLIAKDSIEPQAIHDACRKLGVRRTRLYELIEQFRASPVASSLVARRRGPKEGSSRLTPDQDQLIDDAIKEFYRTRLWCTDGRRGTIWAVGCSSRNAHEFCLAEFAHAVERFDGDCRLGIAAFVGARFQRVADHALVAADRRLDSRAPVVA